jgi:hypothetical protein
MAAETSNGFLRKDFFRVRPPSLSHGGWILRLAGRGLLHLHHNQRHIVMLRSPRRERIRRAHQ